MKAYHVYSWSGEYEQYEEYDHKFFLNEESALKYKDYLDGEHEKLRKQYRLPNGYDMYHGGAIFESIEIIED